MTSMADTQAIDFTSMANDTRFSITLEDNVVHLNADVMEVTENYPMDSVPYSEFKDWDPQHQQVYLIGYMDARTQQPYLYDFDAPGFQRCYELGRTHGETDGVWDDTEEED